MPQPHRFWSLFAEPKNGFPKKSVLKSPRSHAEPKTLCNAFKSFKQDDGFLGSPKTVPNAFQLFLKILKFIKC